MTMTLGKRLQVARRAAGFRTQEVLADMLGVGARTVRNWETDKYQIPAEYRPQLRELLGPFDDEGDPVEIAVRHSELAGFRQTKVIGYYQEQLHEQRREVAG